MNQKTAQKLVDKTRDDYNLIADQFASTRKYNWPEVTKTLGDILKNYSHDQKIIVLDVGCGAGRVFDFFKGYNVEYHGIDISGELIKIAKKTYPGVDFRVGDATDMPYKKNEFDIVFSIATIHHIPSREMRSRFIAEIYRVCKPNGWALVDTWYFWNKPEYQRRIMKSLFSRNGLPLGDFYRPWKDSNGKLLADRYFHAFTFRELKQIMTKCGFVNIENRDFHKKNRNLHITAQKPL